MIKNTSTFIFWNPNPNQRYRKDGTPYNWNGTDCTVRSLARATGWSWHDTFKRLCDEGLRMDMTFDDFAVLQKVYKSLGYIKCSVAKTGSKPTVGEFLKDHPEGKYILNISGHVVCADNGKIYDTWNCCEYKVRSYYEVH